MTIDFGIEYNTGFPNPLPGSIKFCGVGMKNRFVFLETLSDGSTNTIYISRKRMIRQPNYWQGICSLYEANDGSVYYFCNNPLRIIIDYGEEHKVISFQKTNEKYYPISVNVFENVVIATLYPARMMVFSRLKGEMILDLNLTNISIKYPSYVEPYSEGCFLVTDSKNNMIHIVDSCLNIYWEYGKREEHGISDGLLFAPQRAIVNQQGKFVISLRRGHCILIVNKNKNVEQVLGVPFSVGGDGYSLWLPQALYIEKDLYAVMCEGAHIAIVKYDDQLRKWCNFYSECPIKVSQLCQPRSCDYSDVYKMVLVSDTEHDRVIGYDLDGNVKLLIDDEVINNFNSPRCSIFHGENLFLSSSQKRCIYYTMLDGSVLDHYAFDQSLANGQWLQSIDYLEGKLLVAFEKEVVLFSWEKKQILWSTKESNLLLDDVHYAQYLNKNCYLISDNGNDRGIYVRDNDIQFITELYYNGNIIKLSAPRFIRIIDGKMYIINSRTSKILVCDPDTRNLISVFGGVKGLGNYRFTMPRWLCKGPETSIFISDTGNHRILLRDMQQDG